MNGRILGVEEGFGTEATADVGGDDANLLGGQTVESRQLVPDRVGALTRLPMRQTSHTVLVGFFPTAGRHARLEGARSDAAIQDAPLDDHLAGREVHLTLCGQGDDHVAAPIGEEQRARGHRLLGIHHHRQRFVLHLHTFGGVHGLGARLGHHRGHQFPDEPHGVGGQRTTSDVGGQQRHVDGDGTDSVGAQVVRGEHAHHTGHRAGLVGVDREHAPVGDGGSHVHHVRGTRKRQIVDEGSPARDEVRVLGAHHPSTDHAHVVSPSIVVAIGRIR